MNSVGRRSNEMALDSIKKNTFLTVNVFIDKRKKKVIKFINIELNANIA